ncbi:hypothetical protein DMI62_20895 [Escherichia coli]|nr:hypothetical protein [Escherichia coli]
MLKQADVLAENFRPYNGKTRVFMGRLQEINPRLIYASSSGFRTYRSAKRCSCLRYHHSGNERDNDGKQDTLMLRQRVGTLLRISVAVSHLFSGIVSALYGRGTP